jgi:hypothetical protein
MKFTQPPTAAELRDFKSAGDGQAGRHKGYAIVLAILNFYKMEITVYDRRSHDGELFRVGLGNPSHGINGIHIHPCFYHYRTGVPKPGKDAVALITDDDYNKYVGLLLQALELGNFRAGFDR